MRETVGTIAAVGYVYPRPGGTLYLKGGAGYVAFRAGDDLSSNGPEVWYTDPFGRKASTESFPGSIRQFIARIDNTGRVPHGPTIGRDRDYGGPGLHAPN